MKYIEFLKKAGLAEEMGIEEQCDWIVELTKKQTPEICLAAVKQDGFSLKFIEKQTPEICLAAVIQEPHALEIKYNF